MKAEERKKDGLRMRGLVAREREREMSRGRDK